MENKFELLTNRDILDILIGDKPLGEEDGFKIVMPYLTGENLCAINSLFGNKMQYNQGISSRWSLMNDLLIFGIKENKIQDILNYIFSKKNFKKMLKNKNKIEYYYNLIIQTAIEKINSILFFSNNELKVANERFYIVEIGEQIKIETPEIKIVNNDYIKNLQSRAIKNIEEGSFDSALTKSRTILEETFCYVIELLGEKPNESGNINKLYRQVKNLLNMNQNKNFDNQINDLLNGLEKILTSISSMRNKNSDAHGVGKKRIKIEEHHARLFVNSATIFAEFILSVYNKQRNLL